jgi:hypothetical protein
MEFGEKVYIIRNWIKSTDKHIVINISPSGSNMCTQLQLHTCHKIPDAATNEGKSNVIRESASFELKPVRPDMYNLAILSGRPDLDELLEVSQLA